MVGKKPVHQYIGYERDVGLSSEIGRRILPRIYEIPLEIVTVNPDLIRLQTSICL